ncbi:hypothetical protein EO98_18710 [Methanosarcina sp. 2.H.T.1A.6]|nr:hypothetical protein EO94_18180 [Methanosarcina sp. 2.H.T.1A.3]KKG20357.1 hypothetical protein EO98_18710 [Methanosarcina sp. 2.H.T.1A.6]KKG23378.1 hypothetical protein EO96_17145 [Methanosarcina sp. 2.H.T.1A.8]KKG26838.1 hypothetical protein EO97_16505 [Methanosarcina sp. 2.H.T.1A.15]
MFCYAWDGKYKIPDQSIIFQALCFSVLYCSYKATVTVTVTDNGDIRINTVNIDDGKYISWIYDFRVSLLQNIQSMRDIIEVWDISVIRCSDINIFIKMQCKTEKTDRKLNRKTDNNR